MRERQPRVCLVTGASRGIGRAIAVALAHDGDFVLLTARSNDGLSDTLRLVKEAGGDGEIICADLSVYTGVDELANTVLSRQGPVDVIINAAAVWHDDKRAFRGPHLEEIAGAELRQVMGVGILAPMQLTAMLLPSMISNRGGHVVNISGTFSDGAAGWLHYYVSKKAIEQFTIGLAQEVSRHEIQVNCLSPADVATEPYIKFYPEYAKSALSPHEVGDFVLELLSPRFRHVTGQIIELRNQGTHV